MVLLALEGRRKLCHRYVMGKTEVGGTPIVVVSSPGVRGRQRWVAAVPVKEMVAEVRKRIPHRPVAGRPLLTPSCFLNEKHDTPAVHLPPRPRHDT
jgi:hypothetical protein